MKSFDFEHQLEYSRDPMQQLIAWFKCRKMIEFIHDVQRNPQYFYQGDIYLKRYNHEPEFMEVKVETRKSTDTPNMAIERYSDNERQTDGGPWKTIAAYYTHLYADGLIVIMGRTHLLAWLNTTHLIFPVFRANNTLYVTTGILVKRRDAKRALGKSYQEYWLSEEG